MIAQCNADRERAKQMQFAEEQKKDAALHAIRIEADRKWRKRQKALWEKPASALDSDTLISELQKCKNNYDKGDYRAVFSDYDVDETLKNIKSGNNIVEIYGQRKMPFGDSMSVFKVRCEFNGAGLYKSEIDVAGYTDKYIQ